MGNLDQSNSVAALTTPLGENVLVLRSFTGSEGLGEPFGFEIDALSEEENKALTSVRLFSDAIEMKAPRSIELTAGTIRITGNVVIVGSLSVLGAATVSGRPI